jgi:hypothetical protein
LDDIFSEVEKKIRMGAMMKSEGVNSPMAYAKDSALNYRSCLAIALTV